MNFNKKLRQSAEETGSIACMGLDPVYEAIPEAVTKGYPSFRSAVEHFLEAVFKEMNDQKVFAGALKPNAGFYLRHDAPLNDRFEGSRALASVMLMAREMLPAVPIILDYKRGDIAKSSNNYAIEGLDNWQADAVTVAPYMGTDSVSPFAKYCNDEQGKGVYVLNRTSNKVGAADFQSREVVTDMKYPTSTKQLHLVVADKIAEWAKEAPGVGAVVGATSLKELEQLVKLYVESGVECPWLIPGVGGQGGKASEVMAFLKAGNYPVELARINSSSGLTQPWAKNEDLAAKLKGGSVQDYAKACVEALHKLNEQINYKA
jgi:orotidine-5'-phosphate decarboxylase